LKIVAALGKYQYGDKSRGIGTEYDAFLPALINLNHTVAHFELWDKTKYRGYADLNESLLRTVIEENPDLLIAVPMNYEIWLETLHLIRKHTKTITICWTTDDSWKYREVSRFIGGAYDIITTTYPDIVRRYHNDAIQNVFLTQWASKSEKLERPIQSDDCTYDISFIGAAHGNRRERIRYLKQNGLNVTCFGFGWDRGPIAASDIPKIMRSSRISLNFANSKGDNQLKARVFEVPGAGGFLLSEAAKHIENYYEVGEEIDIFRDDQELVKKLRHYLKHKSERDRIANNGFDRTQQDHTYEERFKHILNVAPHKVSARNRISGDQLQAMLQPECRKHSMTRPLRMLRAILLTSSAIFGKQRRLKAARRIIFEISWRIFGKNTFTSKGLPGRLFPEI
jgi:spore maturation protein CgeB